MFFKVVHLKTQGNVIAYSDFLARVNAGEVREVSIQGDKIFGASSSGVPFYSFIPKEEELANKLSEKGIKVTSEPDESSMPGILSVLISWFPMLIIYRCLDLFYETNARWC